VLITVSGTIPTDLEDQIRSGERPQADYLELARATGGDLLDVPAALRRTGRIGRVAQRLGGSGLLLALACVRERKRYDVILTDGEQVGLPLAALSAVTRRSFAHVMIVHILSARKKVLVFRAIRAGRGVDRFLVYSSRQQRFLVDELGVPAEHVVLTTFMVDTEFFSPGAVAGSGGERRVVTAGLERRDYPTLVEAARSLDARVTIAAASPWSKQADSTAGSALPPNVDVVRLGFAPLRQLYADSSVVVMPLLDTPFQAGVTTILEAMAMGKPVVCSRTRGQTDVLVDGETGVYVTPGDAAALREAVAALLDDPDRAAELGAAARAWVEQCDVRRYAARIAEVVADAAAAKDAGDARARATSEGRG
jgi:glycosyltransferase involved in cell wall biosynthesis